MVVLFSFFNELPPVKFVIVEKPANPEGLPVPRVPCFKGSAMPQSTWRLYCKKNNTCGCRCLKKWIGYGCRYNFEHDHYSMGIFTCKSQCSASLRNLCANLMPSGYFSLGKNLSSVSRQSFEVYPHRMELSACTASGRLR